MLNSINIVTLGPVTAVSAWVGDHLWTGKPPRCRTRHPGLLSLSSPSVVRLEWVPGESWSRDTPTGIRGLAVFADAWLKELACGDQLRLTLEALIDDALYKYTFTLLYLTLHQAQLLYSGLAVTYQTSATWICFNIAGIHNTLYKNVYNAATLMSCKCLKIHLYFFKKIFW